MNQTETYIERTLRLKPVIEADSELLDRLRAAFKATYEDIMYAAQPPAVDKDLVHLGSGTVHHLVGLKKSITDPKTGIQIPLAIKFNHHRPYRINFMHDIEEQLGAFDYAFSLNDNPPYFSGIVTARTKLWGRDKHLAGIITEDITNDGKLQLIEMPDSEYAFRINSDESKERFFIDPPFIPYSRNGKLYSADNARIDL